MAGHAPRAVLGGMSYDETGVVPSADAGTMGKLIFVSRRVRCSRQVTRRSGGGSSSIVRRTRPGQG